MKTLDLDNMTQEQLLEQLKEIDRKDLEVLRKLEKYHNDNKLEYFKPNPKQAQIIGAWDNPQYKVFTFTGGNQMGKTTLGIIVALSVMFGEWLWNKKKLCFLIPCPVR